MRALTLLCMGALLGPLSARGEPPTGMAVGRLLFRVGEKTLTPKDARGYLEKGHLSFDLRLVESFAQVQLDDDGVFSARGSPGTYRLEYLYAGEQVEFLPPQLVEIPAEGLACAGTFTLTLKSLEEDLGENRPATRLEVTEGCEGLQERFKRKGSRTSTLETRLARAAPSLETTLPKPFAEYLVGLRVGYGMGPQSSELRATYALAWSGSLRDAWSALAAVSVARLDPGSVGISPRYEMSGALGFTLLPGLELYAGAGIRSAFQPGEVATALTLGVARLDGGYWGLGVRGELPLGGAPTWLVTFELSPFYILGALL